MADNEVTSVYMTFPDEDSARSIAGTLLDERLIACANILPAGRSLYRWEGEVQDEEEVVAFVKTTMARLEELVARVNELHPYDTPCVVALDIDGGDLRYLGWVISEVSPGSPADGQEEAEDEDEGGVEAEADGDTEADADADGGSSSGEADSE